MSSLLSPIPLAPVFYLCESVYLKARDVRSVAILTRTKQHSYGLWIMTIQIVHKPLTDLAGRKAGFIMYGGSCNSLDD